MRRPTILGIYGTLTSIARLLGKRAGTARSPGLGPVLGLGLGLELGLGLGLGLPVILAMPSQAAAQTLDLDGVRQGPTITAENGALDLAAALEEERLALEVAARTLRGEALASAQARMRLRQIAIALLQ